MADGTRDEIEAEHVETLTVEYEGVEVARLVADSVSREIGEIDDDRSDATLEREEESVTLTVGANDLTALRAATNTWMGLLCVAEDSIALADRLMESTS